MLHLQEEGVAEGLPVRGPALQEEARPQALEESLHPAGLPELTTQHGVGQTGHLGQRSLKRETLSLVRHQKNN